MNPIPAPRLSNFIDYPSTRVANPRELEDYRQALLAACDPLAPRIMVCCGTGCRATGSLEVAAALEEAVEGAGWHGLVTPLLKKTGCQGLCSRGPLMVMEPENLFYQRVRPEDAAEIVQQTLQKGQVIRRLQYTPAGSKEPLAKAGDIPFYARQTRLVLNRIGKVDPFDIKDALRHGAYEALSRVLTTMSPAGATEEIARSRLRGRGGAGFPTGQKWESCAKQPGPRYVICNGDEGDPGAFMDAAVMEGDPHAVLEGMAIAAYAIGSNRGYLYVRFEYPLAVKTLTKAIRQAEALGVLGHNILGSGFSLTLSVSTGAGAFICGESSALMSSLEGKVGRPRPKYVRSTEKGFRDSPSVLNNVETFANIPRIILKGGDWFRSHGTERSAGSKVFSLTGNVRNVGLIEVPMGTSLRQIVYDIGGGIPNNKELKAVQTGGPSGGCVPIPSKFLDINVGYGKLAEVGAMMGSGGLIVMDQDTCMVEVSRYFINFLVGESCGQCTPCREGLIRMLEILTRITRGQGQQGDMEFLAEIGQFTNTFSLCGLGTSAANPVLSTMRWFPEEYLAHINDKKCPAGVCKALFHYEINAEACTGCGLCRKKCPVEAISGQKKEPHVIDQQKCIKCMECYRNCKFQSIKVM
ncbi:MAG: NADH-ubiquinone oxidoreductase-F iron-sulfur binding region domain-containing protein [Pseudomonadota bacterium]